ncbi:sugar ABC transporter ATP-binding protein [Demequina lignilytica]|uniref:Sugar ABC transporter ATP-binding protein n=1 Tax=Demequina lignilytica TaxID=3051663 RepID=A0AB35MER2_9MICO|nr:sugar ABC transporter ATP-binding protein [Demequina sp. SYSU T0a273]MDN4482259.1 sugar ABC transporter ATP-binding protein [Demequina sp. SYSU T0a273]
MMTTQAPAFAATGITKTFGPVTALSEVDLSLRAGQVTALMGENGAGKSTLLKILGGDYQPDGGALTMGGEPVTFAEPHISRQHGLRIIAQEPEIIPHVDVAENIFVGALGAGAFSSRALRTRASEAIAEWGFDGVIDASTLGSALSPAQRQVVEIMRALVDRPAVICFDEPTSSLGDDEVAILFRLIRRLRDEGVAIAYVSHRMAEIFRLADTVTVLRDGRLVGTRPASETDEEELVRMMVGRSLDAFFTREPVLPGDPVLELDAVSNEHVDGVSLTVRAGEVVGVAGLVGAGRSELMKTIVGDFAVRSGTMRVDGRVVDFRSPSDSIRAGIGFAPEERKAEALVLQRSVKDNAALAVLRSITRLGFVDAAKERELAQRYVDRLKVKTPSLSQLVGKLSGGNQQKVVLARWLAMSPRLLVLDEPTRGIDVGAKSEIYTIIDELARDGVAVLVVSSELPEVLGLSDRIYVMCDGRIAGEVAREDATEERLLSLAMPHHRQEANS